MREPSIIELRSDTFTLPSPDMLSAITSAPLGDDGYGEDPTVRKLEELASSKFGKSSACLMPSGTMANMAALQAHQAGTRNIVLMGDQSDLWVYENERAGTCLGMKYLPLTTQSDGTIRITDLEKAIKEHGPHVAAIAIENPHNLCGGVVLPLNYCRDVSELALRFGVKLHLDGARIFNAAVASKREPHELAQCADSLQFCLSKGLAAPVGSLVVGGSEFIERVRDIRKWLGGNMRQAGIIAAPGIVALEQMIERLIKDHRNAKKLAEGLAKIPGIRLDSKTIQTNTVVFSIADERFSSDSFIASAMEHGVRLSEFKFGRVRAVVHYGITEAHITEALKRLAKVLQ